MNTHPCYRGYHTIQPDLPPDYWTLATLSGLEREEFKRKLRIELDAAASPEYRKADIRRVLGLKSTANQV